MYQPMGEGRARARKMIERAGYKVGGEMGESKSDTEADIARVKKAFGQHDNQLHGGKRTRLHFANGGMAGDRLDQRPRGKGKAAPAGKHGTQVNIAVLGNKDKGDSAGGPPMAPPPAAVAPPPHPPMPPPHPPMGGPPPGGAMPPPGAGMPPPGMGGPPPGLPPGAGMPPPRPPMMPPLGAMPQRPPGMQSGGRARRLDGGMAAPQGALGMGGAPPMAPPGLAGGMPAPAMGSPPVGMPAGGMPAGMPPGAMGRPPGMKRGGRSMGGNMSSPEEMPRPKAHFRRGGQMMAGAITGEGRLEKAAQLKDLGD